MKAAGAPWRGAVAVSGGSDSLALMFLLLVACGLIYLLMGDRQEACMLLGFVTIYADTGSFDMGVIKSKLNGQPLTG